MRTQRRPRPARQRAALTPRQQLEAWCLSDEWRKDVRPTLDQLERAGVDLSAVAAILRTAKEAAEAHREGPDYRYSPAVKWVTTRARVRQRLIGALEAARDFYAPSKVFSQGAEGGLDSQDGRRVFPIRSRIVDLLAELQRTPDESGRFPAPDPLYARPLHSRATLRKPARGPRERPYLETVRDQLRAAGVKKDPAATLLRALGILL